MKYSEDQIKVSGIKVQGKNAIAVVSSEGTNASSKYTLVAEGGKWRIDSAEIQ